MFKFNKNEELLETIEKQKDQIKRYEGRLGDVVRAYKSLQNEKEALENSMKALTAAVPTSTGNDEKLSKQCESDQKNDASNEKCEENTENQGDESAPCGDQADEPDKQSNLQHLRSQVLTLTQSLSTMSAEKTKMVATYKAEKKKLKQEQDIQMKMVKDENEVFCKKATMLEEELHKVKEKNRAQQIDREREQATHSIMLREIQKMLNDERTKNEANESLVKELRSAAQNAGIEAQQSEDYKHRVRQLEGELEKVRNRLHAAEEEASKPPPLLLQLQEEMDTMKLAHKLQLKKEQSRVVEMEQREREVAHAEEERVSDLEDRLVQISAKMGLYDGKMQQDQISIQHLKDRVSQLDIENALLSKQLEAAKSEERQMDGISMKLKMEDDDLDIDGLKEKILNYQQLLKEAASKSNEPVDLSDLLSSLQSDAEDYRKLYLESQQNLLQLKEEHERYKTRAQNVLKNMKRGRTSSGENQELEEMRRQLQEARERHFHLRARCDDLEAQCVKMTTDHQQEFQKLLLVHKGELENRNEMHQRQLSGKEREIRNHRERTIALLADKDKEIKQLKAYTSTYHSEYHLTASQEQGFSDGEPLDGTEASLSEILSRPGNEKNIIHYAEQLARKDVMINSIRRHKKQLELQIRQLQDANITQDEKYTHDVAVLKEKLLERERGSLRENANMEYLKNVFYRYLTIADHTAKAKMLVALATILQFSPDECRKAGVRR